MQLGAFLAFSLGGFPLYYQQLISPTHVTKTGAILSSIRTALSSLSEAGPFLCFRDDENHARAPFPRHGLYFFRNHNN